MTLQSRIDFWLISLDLEQKVLQAEISPAILTVHKVLTLSIKFEDIQCNSRNVGYWKLNNSLLYHEDYTGNRQTLRRNMARYGNYYNLR